MRRPLLLLALVVVVLSAACSFSRTNRRSSNLMSYLYPEGSSQPVEAAAVQLQLPLRLGIAFVPPSGETRWASCTSIVPPQSEKKLLEIVKKEFQSRDWVKDIVVIPSAYLAPGGGFDNLDQVSRMFGVDVIALASVDQLQSSDPTRISFLYLSVIGAYTLPLDRHDTRTLIDMAVFHVPSRRFLLRAPGTSHIRGRSTAVDVNAAMRDKSDEGMKLAMSDLSANLSPEVESFKQSVISGRTNGVDVVNRSGQSIRTSGDIGAAAAVLSVLVACLVMASRDE